MTGLARLRYGGRRVGLGLILAAGLSATATAASDAVIAGARSGGVSFSLANAAAGSPCSTLGRPPSTSPGEPVKVLAGVGSTQSTPAGAPFPIRLAVTVTDAEANPVPGVPVTFSAPAAGASGRFTTRSRGSRPRTARVKTDACGIAVAPVFTADRVQGGYIVKASVRHVQPAAFALVNEAPGRSS